MLLRPGALRRGTGTGPELGCGFRILRRVFGHFGDLGGRLWQRAGGVEPLERSDPIAKGLGEMVKGVLQRREYGIGQGGFAAESVFPAAGLERQSRLQAREEAPRHQARLPPG